MIIGNIALFEIDPFLALFAAAIDFCLMGDACAHDRTSAGYFKFSRRRRGPFPTVDRLLLAIGGSIVIKETWAGAIVAMELDILAVLFPAPPHVD
jgi:hypothetical protein